MEVQILSKKFIKPSPPSPPDHLIHKKIKVSAVDQLAPPYHIPFLLYYLNNGCGGVGKAEAESVKMREQLEKSLSQTLTLFYPLAGRFIPEELLVECNDEGAAFWEARASGEIASFVDRAGRPDLDLLRPLLPSNLGAVDASTTPLLAIQVNVFECGGVAIGVLVSHRIADAFTFVAFIDAWAKASRGAFGEVCIPSFELGSLIPAIKVPPIVSPELEIQTMYRRSKGKMVTRTFVFDGPAIKSLKSKARGNKTRHEVVSALIWLALMRASQSKHGCIRPSLLSQAVNLRGKTQFPIPKSACGNFVASAKALFKPNESKMELHDLATLVGESIKNVIASFAKAPDGDEFVRVLTNSFGESRAEWVNDGVDMYVFSSWCRFPYYEADFGWGKPSWVSRMSMPLDVVFLFDTKCGNGIEAWVSLSEEDMLRFQQDQDIVDFCS